MEELGGLHALMGREATRHLELMSLARVDERLLAALRTPTLDATARFRALNATVASALTAATRMDHMIARDLGRYDSVANAAARTLSQYDSVANAAARTLGQYDSVVAEAARIAAIGSGLNVSGMDAALAAWQRYHEHWATAAAVTRSGVPTEPASQHAELLIPAAIILVGEGVAEGQLIEAVTLPWFDILEELQRDPNFLYQLDWRRLEELIAGAYKREGWSEVILTRRSGDGGRDIIASRPDWGTIRFYDQVKAYTPGHKVPADDVRALYGVLNLHQNVSKAVITTTALFAPGVHEEFKAVMPNRLELRDGPKLREWLMGLSVT